jgi:hypothetical protein
MCRDCSASGGAAAEQAPVNGAFSGFPLCREPWRHSGGASAFFADFFVLLPVREAYYDHCLPQM